MKSVISILAMLLVMGTTTLRAAESDGIPAKAPKADLNTKQMKKIEEGIYEIPESKGILLTHIPAGEFIMGSPESKIGRRTDEVQHKVKITKPFYMGVKEITQAQYMSAMHPDHQELAWKSAAWGHHIPSFFVGGPWSVELTNVKSPLSSERPMEMLTWDEASLLRNGLTNAKPQPVVCPKVISIAYLQKQSGNTPAVPAAAELSASKVIARSFCFTIRPGVPVSPTPLAGANPIHGGYTTCTVRSTSGLWIGTALTIKKREAILWAQNPAKSVLCAAAR